MTLDTGHPVAHAVAMNADDSARLQSLFRGHLLPRPDPAPHTEQPPPAHIPHPTPNASTFTPTPRDTPNTTHHNPPQPQYMDATKANLRHVTTLPKLQLLRLLHHHRTAFPEEQKQDTTCKMSPLRLPFINERCKPFSCRQRRFDLAEHDMTRREIGLLPKSNIIRKSVSSWAVQVEPRKNIIIDCKPHRGLEFWKLSPKSRTCVWRTCKSRNVVRQALEPLRAHKLLPSRVTLPSMQLRNASLSHPIYRSHRKRRYFTDT